MLASGKLKKAGRVDHGDTLLDSHILEKERGITIFSSQAVMETGELEITLLDTPGQSTSRLRQSGSCRYWIMPCWL